MTLFQRANNFSRAQLHCFMVFENILICKIIGYETKGQNMFHTNLNSRSSLCTLPFIFNIVFCTHACKVALPIKRLYLYHISLALITFKFEIYYTIPRQKMKIRLLELSQCNIHVHLCKFILLRDVYQLAKLICFSPATNAVSEHSFFYR